MSFPYKNCCFIAKTEEKKTNTTKIYELKLLKCQCKKQNEQNKNSVFFITISLTFCSAEFALNYNYDVIMSKWVLSVIYNQIRNNMLYMIYDAELILTANCIQRELKTKIKTRYLLLKERFNSKSTFKKWFEQKIKKI